MPKRSAFGGKADIGRVGPECPLIATSGHSGISEMIVVRSENRVIQMKVKTGYYRSQFEGYLGNVGSYSLLAAVVVKYGGSSEVAWFVSFNQSERDCKGKVA